MLITGDFCSLGPENPFIADHCENFFFKKMLGMDKTFQKSQNLLSYNTEKWIKLLR